MKNILFISGGNDSSYIFHLMDKREHFDLIFFDYGQKYANQELKVVKQLPQDVQMRLTVRKIPRLVTTDNGFFYGRNLAFLIDTAERYDEATIFVGSNKDDVFPDNCREFYKHAVPTVNRSYNTNLKVVLPLSHTKKDAIVRYIKKNQIPTYSCYEGKAKPCGKCKACLSVMGK
jgi:7-cyano-7-deazaguanine synthase in queuosine biosynthesis